MRTAYRAATAVCVALLAACAALADPPPARQKELFDTMAQQCTLCHGTSLQGISAPSLRPETIASKSDDYLAGRIHRGVPGTAMPNWGARGISLDDAHFIVKQLRAGWVWRG